MPEAWYVLYGNESEFEAINKYYNKNWEYFHSNYSLGYFNINVQNNWVCIDVNTKGVSMSDLQSYNAVEVSFKDWEQIFIYNQDVLEPGFEQENNLECLVNLLKTIK